LRALSLLDLLAVEAHKQKKGKKIKSDNEGKMY
jgi:hypothetical protein